MTDHSLSPALSDEELRETLEMVGTVLASVSDRVDAQTTAMDKLVKTATEARQAAFAAQNQTDPELYGEILSEQVFHKLDQPINLVHRVSETLSKSAEHAGRVIEKGNELIETERLTLYREVRAREEKAVRLKRNLPWFGLGAVVLALVMSVTLPRFSAINGTTCTVFGGVWTQTTVGQPACVHYQD